MRCPRWLLSVGFVGSMVTTATAQEVRFYQENGVTYQETKRTVQRPIVEGRWENREETVYVEQAQTELHPSTRVVRRPVTEWGWQARLKNRWNPLSQPYYAYEWAPSTRYEYQNETVHYPVVVRSVVPEKRSRQVYVTAQRVVNEEHVSRVAVNPTAPRSTDPFAPPGTTYVGGVRRLDQPPRVGSAQWVPSGTRLR